MSNDQQRAAKVAEDVVHNWYLDNPEVEMPRYEMDNLKSSITTALLQFADEARRDPATVQPNGPDGEIPVGQRCTHHEFALDGGPCVHCRRTLVEVHADDLACPVQAAPHPPCPRCAQLERDKAELVEGLRERIASCSACFGKGWSEAIEQGFGKPFSQGPCPHCANARTLIARHGKGGV